jgi:hypothetical protein
LVDRIAWLEGGVIAARAERAGRDAEAFRQQLVSLGQPG